MVFSSNLFLFFFVPVFFLIYFATPLRGRNVAILVASLLFYAFGSGAISWILVASIVFNDVAAREIAVAGAPRRKGLLVAAIAINLLPLFYYKYLGFTASTLAATGMPINMDLFQGIALPIGISFFTFQAISYLVDVYSRTVSPARTTLEFGMYHTLYPQLVAGPIVRYSEIQKEINSRHFVLENFTDGARRFCLGLGKKVLLADSLAVVVDHVFGLPGNELTAPVCWFAIACFSLQIYLDFSAYSDMAIGLGRMLGFTFPENFAQPYRASSVTDFWRRWHMTLTRFFRDYVYVPLGGNRMGQWRTNRNLFAVFVLCGLWHGASLTFLVWGLYHGLLLSVERLLRSVAGIYPAGFVGTVTTVFLVTLGWIPFRSPDLEYAWRFTRAVLGFGQSEFAYYPLSYYVTPANLTVFMLGMIVAFFPIERLRKLSPAGPGMRSAVLAGAFTVLLLSIVAMSAGSFRPFIYFQF